MPDNPADISRHPLLKNAHELCITIEKCGASPELTRASLMASTLMDDIHSLILRAIEDQNERDALGVRVRKLEEVDHQRITEIMGQESRADRYLSALTAIRSKFPGSSLFYGDYTREVHHIAHEAIEQ
jgi:hypothetical protein